MNSVVHLDTIWGFSIQPGTNGNVFASACSDGILRLFDIRHSVTGMSLNFFHCPKILFFKFLNIYFTK